MRTRLRFLSLAALIAGVVGLSGCDRSAELDVAAEFFARIDSAQPGLAWELLTDADKAGVSRAAFAAMYTDTSRVSQYDTILGTQEISRGPDGLRVKQIRVVPDWNLVRSLRRPGRSMRELAASLHEGGTLRMLPDSSRVVTVIGSGKAARISIGTAKQVRYHQVLDSLEVAQLTLLEGQILSADPRPNIGVWCNAKAELRSRSEIELREIRVAVDWKGKPLGIWEVKSVMTPGRTWRGEIGIMYAAGMGPEKMGPSPLPGKDFVLKVVAAEPADPNELRLQAQRLTGIEPLELL